MKKKVSDNLWRLLSIATFIARFKEYLQFFRILCPTQARSEDLASNVPKEDLVDLPGRQQM